jgi:hypothetical protein
MLLNTLKTKLQVVTGSAIGEVFFDFKDYLNEKRSKTYPCILWQLDGAEIVEDLRSSTIQQTAIITLTVFAIALYRDTQDKITVWDTVKGQFKTYINLMDATAGIQILNIDKLEAQLAGEGMIDADQEVGIMYKNVKIKLWC